MKGQRGTEHHAAVLTEALVCGLRIKKQQGWTYRQLCELTGLPKVTVYDAVRGATWSHVVNPGPVEKSHHGRFDETK